MKEAREVIAKFIAVGGFTEDYLEDADGLIAELDKAGFVITPVVRKPMDNHAQERRDQFERGRKK